MLMVSYCEHPVSIVHVSCVANIYIVHPLEATILLQSSVNFTRMFDMVISWSSSNMGQVKN